MGNNGKDITTFGLRFLVVVLIFVVIFIIPPLVCQSDYIYFPESLYLVDPSFLGLEFEEIVFETEDRIKLFGWYMPSQSTDSILLYCHGNAGNISHRLDTIKIFYDLGISVFIFDYRGYGKSEGQPTEHGTYEDAIAAWNYLTETRLVDPARVIIFGRSLGGSIAAWLAQDKLPAGLILESTFTSLADIAAKLYPYLPVRMLLLYSYNTFEYLSQVQCPVLIIHSRDDEIIPYEHAESLFDVTNEPKQFLEIIGSHNEGFITSGERYREGIESFIDLCLSL